WQTCTKTRASMLRPSRFTRELWLLEKRCLALIIKVQQWHERTTPNSFSKWDRKQNPRINQTENDSKNITRIRQFAKSPSHQMRTSLTFAPVISSPPCHPERSEGSWSDDPRGRHTPETALIHHPRGRQSPGNPASFPLYTLCPSR